MRSYDTSCDLTNINTATESGRLEEEDLAIHAAAVSLQLRLLAVLEQAGQNV